MKPNSHPIYNAKGEVIGTSRNLAGIRRYVAKGLPIKRITLEGTWNSAGKLKIVFENGDHYDTTFGSFTVLAGWVRRWANVQGVPLTMPGCADGFVSRDNVALDQAARGEQHGK